MPPFWPDVPEVREDLADYLGEAQAVDAAVGLLVDELRRAGELERTLVDELRRTGDPRLIDDGRHFETPPLAGPLPDDVPHPDRTRHAAPNPGKATPERAVRTAAGRPGRATSRNPG